METNVIVIIAAIIIGFIVLKFITKVIVKLISVAVVAGFIIFVLFYWGGGGVLNTGNTGFMLDELEQKYCHEQVSEIKCNCIIEPISNDVRSRFNKQEIAELQQNKMKSMRVLLMSALRNKAQIQKCLRDNNALDEWDKFMKDLKGLDVENQMNDMFKKLGVHN